MNPAGPHERSAARWGRRALVATVSLAGLLGTGQELAWATTPAGVRLASLVAATTLVADLPAPPPLLRPGLLDPWPAADAQRANRPLAEWVAECAAELPPSERLIEPPADLATQAKALRLYVQGRAAALEGRGLIAAQKLEEALSIDPESADILAAYARVLVRMGNGQKAQTLYQRLLRVDPRRPEALLTIGLEAANRGDAKATVALLGALLLDPATLPESERADREDFWDSLRADALLAIELSLVRALNELGADTALIEVLDHAAERSGREEQAGLGGQPTRGAPAAGGDGELALSGPPAVECRRLAGDARARRGDAAGALVDWREALRVLEKDMPGDRALGPIVARILWAEVALGTTALSTLQHVIDTTGVRDEWIALAAWLASAPAPAAADDGIEGRNTDAERRRFASRVDVRVGDPLSARLAAALVPARAFERLAASHDRRHPDRGHLHAWLSAAAAQDQRRTIDIAANLLDDCALEPELLVDALLGCGLDAPTLLRLTAPDVQATPPTTPARLALHLRLLAAFGFTRDALALGAAWRAPEPPAVPDPAHPHGGAKRDDPRVVHALISVAVQAARGEEIPVLAAAVADADIPGQIELMRAWRMDADLPTIKAACDRVRAAAEDPRAIALARSLYAAELAAAGARDRQREQVAAALDEFRAAVEADPSFEAGWAQLLSVTRALARGSNAAADNQRAAQEEAALRRQILQAVPESTLAFGLDHEALMTRGRSGDALEAIVARVASTPWDQALLREAARALSASQRSDEALALLDGRISRAPAQPIVWRQWTEIAVSAGKAEEAVDRLTARIERDDPDPIAQDLIAEPLRAAHRPEEALHAEEAVAGRQAPSRQRDIAIAAAMIADERLSTEEFSPGADKLEEIASSVAELRSKECFVCLELALRLPSKERADRRLRDPLIATFAEELLRRAEKPETSTGMEPAAVVRAAGAMALVRREPDQAKDRATWAARAIAAQAASAEPLAPTGAAVWLDLAQRFADEGRFADGSDFLGALATSEVRMGPEVAARLATACFALDAAAGGRAARSIALLDLARSRGVRPFAGRERTVERDSDELYLLAGLYSLVNDREGSQVILRASLERDPGHGMSLNNLGWDLLDHTPPGSPVDPEVVSMIERAHQAMPDDASVLDSIGWLRHRQGRDAEAYELLGKAVAASKGDPGVETLDHLGDVAMALGLRDKAMEAWRQVIDLVSRSFGHDVIVTRLPTYESNEHGVRVIDAESLWYRHYGEVAERAKDKLDAAGRESGQQGTGAAAPQR